jgi:hypothetical protein
MILSSVKGDSEKKSLANGKNSKDVMMMLMMKMS